jgi:hypothetical protein
MQRREENLERAAVDSLVETDRKSAGYIINQQRRYWAFDILLMPTSRLT